MTGMSWTVLFLVAMLMLPITHPPVPALPGPWQPPMGQHQVPHWAQEVQHHLQ